MRPPPPWLPPLLFCSLGAATPPPGHPKEEDSAIPKEHIHHLWLLKPCVRISWEELKMQISPGIVAPTLNPSTPEAGAGAGKAEAFCEFKASLDNTASSDQPRIQNSVQLATPQHAEIRLYNDEQVLSWKPATPSNDTGPVVYRVEYTYSDNNQWVPTKVCTEIMATKCDFTRDGPLTGFPPLHTVSLRVRAEQGNRTSHWVMLPKFQFYSNVTVGPPKNLSVTPGEGSLIIHFSPPFQLTSVAIFEYIVHYWERAGIQQQVKGPSQSNSIVLDNLKPFRVYCLQVEAHLVVKSQGIHRAGHLSNTSCHETTADASTKLQQVLLISTGAFFALLALSGACFFLFLKYQSLVKYWFHAPPSIPAQIEEYLKDPAQPILEALDRDSSPKDDAWDSVSIISFPEKEQENMLQIL